MKRLFLSLLALSVVAAVAAGCKTRERTVINEGPSVGLKVDQVAPEMRYNQVSFLDPGYNQKVAVESTGANRTATNTLEVFAVFRNRTQYDQQFQVRTQYFNADRSPYEGPNEWQTIFLPANGTQTYRTYSRGVGAAFYYIEATPLR